MEFLCWYSASAFPAEATEILSLITDHTYRLLWYADVAVWSEYGDYAWGRLTLDLEDIGLQTIPTPDAILLGSIGVGLVGLMRRRRAL